LSSSLARKQSPCKIETKSADVSSPYYAAVESLHMAA
jgi:hypothetical protein